MKTAMILAAGRGERLKPITNTIPKALCQVRGKPVIEHHIISLAKASYERIIINHAYLGDQLRHYLGTGQQWGVKLIYSPEPPGGLETGGGIFNALPLLGPNPFLVINADIYLEADYDQFFLPPNALANLILGKNPPHNLKGDFGVVNNYLTNCPKTHTYLGIAYYHPLLFTGWKIGRYSIIPLLREKINDGYIAATLFDGQWWDIGSPQRLKGLNQNRQ